MSYANNQVFTASGTFTVPAGVSKVYLTGCGAGAGGGAASWQAVVASTGAGGEAGESCSGTEISVTSGASITVTIGTGGGGGEIAPDYNSGGAVYMPAGPGYNGGSTSFGSLKTLVGGNHGSQACGRGSGYGYAASGGSGGPGNDGSGGTWAQRQSGGTTNIGLGGTSPITSYGAGGNGGGPFTWTYMGGESPTWVCNLSDGGQYTGYSGQGGYLKVEWDTPPSLDNYIMGVQ